MSLSGRTHARQVRRERKIAKRSHGAPALAPYGPPPTEGSRSLSPTSAPLLLAGDAVMVPVHLYTWTVLKKVSGLFTRGHLRTVDPTIASERGRR